ncbi:RsmB/NOP family class I SAM-dependent RNA methyltransferase [Sphingomonas sp. ABOLE]|uniref:RsmB/NOP family class I SAM-dependent RNA methyltransferase n=1 Tax=Sphingomonas sp. ABOLE TaxID=1985878 RepID=UPI000F7E71C5|nr:RsmB/NOP family class I SAM-dependent RNA methyltransferase [Sphingomonas sp. ABOLE]RSV40500.1 RsmB/NOP family class I SAM-dependent RNA methyltransferase [Sphingomonas sp. ABOLE]
MTPAARVQMAIDLLDQVIAAARNRGAAADVILARWFAERRFAGAKDRRAVRALVYDAIRRCGEVPVSGRAAMLALAQTQPALADLFDGSRYGPAAIAAGEPVAAQGVAPAWLEAAFEASGLDGDECAALLDRAPLDLRVNRLKATPEAVAALFDGAERLAFAPDALRLPEETPVDRTEAYVEGAFEVQDAGSQLVSALAGAAPGTTVIDLCAGGGGKTLALAAAMANQGRILACDVDRPRLSKLMPRAERAGVTIAETLLLNPAREAEALADWREQADLVVVDAPCSGTGTWRRNPEARWRLTPAQLDRYVDTQAHLLDVAARLVRPGGALVHIVCSLLDAEGAGQVERFVAAQPGWAAVRLDAPAGRPRGEGLRLTPLHDTTDGFFVAKLVRQC